MESTSFFQGRKSFLICERHDALLSFSKGQQSKMYRRASGAISFKTHLQLYGTTDLFVTFALTGHILLLESLPFFILAHAATLADQSSFRNCIALLNSYYYCVIREPPRIEWWLTNGQFGSYTPECLSFLIMLSPSV